MTSNDVKILLSFLGLMVVLGCVGCGQKGPNRPASIDGDEQQSAHQEPSAADRRCAELVAQTPPLSDRVLGIQPVVAEHALKLVDAGCWKEAAALLEKLGDIDFIVPQHYETMDIDDNGVHIVEAIPEHGIGNRHAALVRCYYHLGRLQETRPHVWKVIEDGRFEPTCFRSIIELNHADLETVVQRAKSISADEPPNRTPEMLLKYVELVRLLDAKRFDQAIDTIIDGCSCPEGEALGSKDAYDRLAAETVAERGAVVIPHLVAKLQPRPDEVYLCVVHALELSGDERALRALVTAREGVRNYGMGQRLDQAIDGIRQRLANALD